ncbi:MAG: hypothetical protein GQ569_13980, partial [Methylococcaceae bacterium]|nr:hypothetical protein [Methylococcaceae bacterium]
HREQSGHWQLMPPDKNNPYKLFPIWAGIDDFLSKKSGAQPLNELYDYLQKPPYGVQKGTLSLIFIAYYLSKQRHLALYESGTFCSHVTQEHFEILLKRPELFSVEAFTFSGLKMDVFNQYLERLVGKSPEESTLIDIVKPLARFIDKLPVYTLSTRNLDKQTIAVRDVFQNTASPMDLLFSQLPIACGLSPYKDEVEFNQANPVDFLNTFVAHLNSLNKAYDDLLEQFQQQLTQVFELSETLSRSALRKELKQRYAGLEKYTIDGIGLQAFIKRLQNEKESDKAWLESIATFLGKAPPDKWKQNNITQAEYTLIDLSERLKQLAMLHTEQQLQQGNNSQATLIRMVNAQGEVNQVAYITDDLKNTAKQKIAELDLTLADKQLKLTILAQLMAELAE